MLQEVLKATKARVLRSDNFFKDSFFPALITEWNNLDPQDPQRDWEYRGQKSFGCLGEWHKSPGKHSWQSKISEKVGRA